MAQIIGPVRGRRPAASVASGLGAVTDEVPGPLAGRVPFAMNKVHPVPAAPAGSRQHVMASDNEPTDLLLKPGEVARLLRVSTVTLTNWSRAGKLTPVLTPGGHHRYRASEIAQYTRTIGEVVLNKNGAELDVWLRVNGRPHWFSMHRADVERFLAGDETCTALPASETPTKSPLRPYPPRWAGVSTGAMKGTT